jgi:hypothetical protein
MAWTQKNERVWSRLAQISLQGPCTMQNWKKKNMRFLNRRFVRLACSRNLWSIFEMWYELQMHKKEMLRTRLQVNTQYMCIYIYNVSMHINIPPDRKPCSWK